MKTFQRIKKLSAQKKRKETLLFNKLNKDFIKMGCFLLFFSPSRFRNNKKRQLNANQFHPHFPSQFFSNQTPQKPHFFNALAYIYIYIYTHTHTPIIVRNCLILDTQVFLYTRHFVAMDEEKEEKTRACS
jgi:hypothetical protein